MSIKNLYEYLTKKKKTLKYVALVAVISPIIVGVAAYIYFSTGLPAVTNLVDYRPSLITKVYSDTDEVIGEFYIERRVLVELSKMPDHMIKAFLAAEDTKFFEHKGIDYLGIMRAIYKNLKAGSTRQGASTITQQVAKNVFLSSERTYSRKIKEAILAYRLEKHLSKEEILYLYLNQIYFGNGAYGVQAASENYFGKNVEDLNIAESALLAGLPKAPSTYSPYKNRQLAERRQGFVINRMLEEGYITREVAASALMTELVLKPKKQQETIWVAPYFTEHVRRYIEEEYGENLLYKGGLKIYTTLNIDMQKSANEAIAKGLKDHDTRRGYRGAIGQLETKEALEAYRRVTDAELLKEPLEVGGVYRGVVTEVKRSAKTVLVDIGTQRGFMKSRDFSLARIYNPENDPKGAKRIKPINAFKVGDVIEVEVKTIPEVIAKEDSDKAKDRQKPTPLIALKLHQEPLAEAALFAVEPATGAVKAMIGGSKFGKTQFNRAVQAKRQPGSAFKPIIYSAAIDSGYTPATIVIDAPLIFEEIREITRRVDKDGNPIDITNEELSGDEEATDEDLFVTEEETWQWKPSNYNRKFNGPTTIRTGITKSRNIISIKVLKDIGINKAVKTARALGITAPLAKDLSLALGASAVTLEELTGAYSAIANSGIRTEPIYITKVTDRYDNVLEESTLVQEQALSPQTAYIIANLLEGVVQNGTGRKAKRLNRPVGGKTGTTNNLNDAWFLGFAPQLAAGVWIGYDEERSLGTSETGYRAASPMWVDFMEGALKNLPVENFPIPEGLEFVKIDSETGLLATPRTLEPIFEVFKNGTAPTEFSVDNGSAMPDDDFLQLDTEEVPFGREDGLPPRIPLGDSTGGLMMLPDSL